MTYPTATTTCEEIDAIALWVLMENRGDYEAKTGTLHLRWPHSEPIAKGEPFTIEGDTKLGMRVTMRRHVAAEQWLTRSAFLRAGWRAACPLDDFAREALGEQ